MTLLAWTVAVALWATAATVGVLAWHHVRATPDAPFSLRERRVAWRFWWRRWWHEECGPVLYWFTVALVVLAVLLTLALVTGG